MKKPELLPALLFASALLSASVVSAGPPPAPDPDLLAARESVWRAWFTHDEATFRRIVSKDLIALGAVRGSWEGFDASVAASARFVAEGGKLIRINFPRTEMQRYGDVAILYSTYEVEMESQGARSTLAGRATEVFVRRSGRWEHPGWHLDPGK